MNTTTEWAQNNQNITVICPHPRHILNNPLLSGYKSRINGMHTITIDLINNPTAKTYQKTKTGDKRNLNESL